MSTEMQNSNLLKNDINKAIQDIEKTRQGSMERKVKRMKDGFSHLRTPEAIAAIDAKAAKDRENSPKPICDNVDEKNDVINSVVTSINACVTQMLQDSNLRKAYDFSMLSEDVENEETEEVIDLVLQYIKHRMEAPIKYSKGQPHKIIKVVRVNEAADADIEDAFRIDFNSFLASARDMRHNRVGALVDDKEFVKLFKKALWKKRFSSIGRFFGLKRKKVDDGAKLVDEEGFL